MSRMVFLMIKKLIKKVTFYKYNKLYLNPELGFLSVKKIQIIIMYNSKSVDFKIIDKQNI